MIETLRMKAREADLQPLHLSLLRSLHLLLLSASAPDMFERLPALVSFAPLISSPSLSLPLYCRFFSTSSPLRPPPPSFRTRSLIASCCHKSNYIGVVSIGNRLPSFPLPPISHLITHCYHHLTSLAPPPHHLYLSAHLHTPLFLFLSLSRSLSLTHTHTQNEQINYVAMREREEITAAQDDKSGW